MKALDTQAILQAITSIDTQGAFKGITYEFSENNSLASVPWWVSIPYGAWPVPEKPPVQSPLESAMTGLLTTAGSAQCFIDIVQLAQHAGSSAKIFFTDAPGSYQSVANVLIQYINQLPAGVTPVIRYLVGSQYPQDPNADGFVEALFASTSNKVTNKNALLYYGNFSPDFGFGKLSGKALKEGKFDSFVSSIWKWIIKEIEAISEDVAKILSRVGPGQILEWILVFLAVESENTGDWNHGKMLAINGEQLLTGGFNYWDDYASGQTWLFDLGMQVSGGAAASAHHYMDYLWNYLNNLPSGSSLISQATSLTGSAPAFSPAQAPMFGGSPNYTGNLNGLMVGKSGIATYGITDFSAQIIDALRDLLLNVVAAVDDTQPGSNGKVTSYLVELLSDSNSEFVSQIELLGVNPASWASRYARC